MQKNLDPVQIYSAPQILREFSLGVISTSLDFIGHREEANLLSNTLVKHLEFRGNSEAITNKELAFSKYNVEGLLQGRKHPSTNMWEESKKRCSRGSAECRQPKKRKQNGTCNERVLINIAVKGVLLVFQ